MSGNAFAVVFALAAGVAAAVQAAINAALGRRIGTLEAAMFQTIVGVTVFAVVTLVARQSLAGVGNAFREPAWLWLGGVMGAMIVTAIISSIRVNPDAPRIRTVAATFPDRDSGRLD